MTIRGPDDADATSDVGATRRVARFGGHSRPWL